MFIENDLEEIKHNVKEIELMIEGLIEALEMEGHWQQGGYKVTKKIKGSFQTHEKQT